MSLPKLLFRQAQFVTSAPSIKECPPDIGHEVAFAGRSNAGKSSAINRLTENKKLAKTSKTPGRTQLINFFALSEMQRLVDLPGYGFAKVPIEVKEKWQRHLEQYLSERQSLRGLVLLADSRLPMQDFDQMMINWSEQSQMPMHILLTKADKLKKGPAKSALLKLERQLQPYQGLITAQLFSAHSGQGLDELKNKLEGWLNDDEEDQEPEQ